MEAVLNLILVELIRTENELRWKKLRQALM
ncbi:hypothetical protein CFE_2506 [Carboxydocella thermautotrophica]|uniref:Uncharacterized protein n=1 Tax=Carboxydocella thermautotrophica TaxID=178899 RepID=A0A2R4N3U0_CARTR|nr:hypothetical protein CFE_2506 [Carboxydocella thermautotrophica]AVX32060.1 hypothetical protein CTH_2521 [Carboxydocella thermautotrophica]